MTLLNLPGLKEMVTEISDQKKLPKAVVEDALSEALLKGYEKFRRSQRLGEYVFDEEYFNNFEVELDLEEEGFRVLATKAIVETIDNSDHQIGLHEVQAVAPEAQLGDTVVLDVTPDKEEFGRMAAIQTKQVLAQKLRDHQRKMIQEEFQDLDDHERVLNAKVLRFERQSVIMEVSSEWRAQDGRFDPPVSYEWKRAYWFEMSYANLLFAKLYLDEKGYDYEIASDEAGGWVILTNYVSEEVKV